MFIDTAKIYLKAGNGGNGAVSFHREKYVAAGGPDGGDGGRGGNIVFVADPNLSTLMDFRYKRKYAAPNGEDGRGAPLQRQKRAGPCHPRAPRHAGARRRRAALSSPTSLADEPVVVAQRRARAAGATCILPRPRGKSRALPSPACPGEELEVRLELKLIADVGLIGFPNVGKSTLISAISAAKPKIANYHFTTLSPVLGVVRVGPEASFVAADIPGLIEGAADGVGLGHDFLRHVDRCRLLLHVVDVSGSEGRDPKDDFETINAELARLFAGAVPRGLQIVLGNKCDIASAEEQIAEFRAFIEEKGLVFLPVSAATRQGLDELPGVVYERLQQLPPGHRVRAGVRPARPCIERPPCVRNRHAPTTARGTSTRPGWKIFWKARDVSDYESLQYFQRQLADSGVHRQACGDGRAGKRHHPHRGI